MAQFQISEKFQSECLLFIDKGNYEKYIPGYTFTFCITHPVAKKVKLNNLIELAPRPIQSSSCNVHYKHEGLKRLCVVNIILQYNEVWWGDVVQYIA